MLLKSLALSVAAMMSAYGCSTTPSIVPTVKPVPPASCLTQCDPLTAPVDGSELSVRNWEFQVVEQYGQCRRLHSDCVGWVSK